MISLGHYNAREITRQIDMLVDRFHGLQEPLDHRSDVLEESLRWHQLAFDADVEIQWINEKQIIADSRTLSHSLTLATNALRKHEQLSLGDN